MFSALELPFRSYRNAKSDLFSLRPLFYGVVSPSEFLCLSVDSYLSEVEEGFADSSRPEADLVDARRSIQENGMTPAIAEMLKEGCKKSLQKVPSREKLQLWHCLRALSGGFVEEEGFANSLLGVVFEFHRKGNPCLLAVYSDGSAISAGDRLIRSTSREEGDSRGWVGSILADSSLMGVKVALSEDSLATAPHPGELMISFLYPAGIRLSRFKEDGVAATPYGDLFFAATTLWTLLDSDAEPVRLGLDLDSPTTEYASLSNRFGAFILDLIFYALFLGAVAFFTKGALASWSFPALLSLGGLACLIPPLLGAWMESSPTWGFRTFGKQFMSCQVASVSTGGGPTFIQALARNVSKWFISPPFLFCGFLWAGFHRYHRAWHDVLSDTVVLIYRGDEEQDLPEDSVLASRS